MDQAASEVAGALTAIAASGAAVLSLASIIRQANGFDTLPATAAAATTTEVVKEQVVTVVAATEEQVIDEEPAPQVVVATTAPVATVTLVAENKATEVAVEQEQESVVVLAAAAPEAETKQEEEEKKEEAPTLSLSKADPVTAAALLEVMTSDAPVGATPPGAAITIDNGSGNGSGNHNGNSKGTENERELVAVAATAPATTPITSDEEVASAAAAAAEYEARLARVRADSTLVAPPPTAAPAAVEKKQASPRIQRVGILNEKYHATIEALWASYEAKKAQVVAQLAKQEKLTMDLAALDALQEAQKKAESAAAAEEGTQNPIAVAWAKVVAVLTSIWALVLAIVASVFGSGNNTTSSSSSASA